VEMLKGLMPEPATNYSHNKMIKVFTSVMALLSITDGFKPDEQGNVSLTQDQLKTIDDELKKQNDACKQASDVLKKQKSTIEQLTKEKNDLEEQVKNLKGSAGTKEEENVDGAENTLSGASELWDSIKNAL
ncbi:MAG: hypothetical protein IJ546_08435, partial [Prevotella sp.]|nr:hypothetical protein [Prevotella sp.]